MNAALLLLVLCVAGGAVVANPVAETSGRGFGSSLWSWTLGWVWPAEPPAPAPAPAAAANVTVRCGEQTCTTVRCARGACETSTCGIYDTDTRGECRVYNVTSLTAPTTTAKPPATATAEAVAAAAAAAAAESASQPVQLVAAGPAGSTPTESVLSGAGL